MRVAHAVAAILALGASSALAQAPLPGGPELPLNANTAGDQTVASVAVEASGGYIAVWRSGPSVVAARRLDVEGRPIGTDFGVNLVLPPNTGEPGVAAHPAGGFVVIWTGLDADGYGIVARRYDANAQPVGGEIAVNAGVAGQQTFPRIAARAQGYVAAFTSGTNVVVRLFGPDMSPQSGDIVVGTGSYPDVAGLPNGFAVAFTTGVGAEVRVQRFDAAGAPAGPSQLVSGPSAPAPFTSWSRNPVRIASAPNGALIVTWHLVASVVTGGFVPTVIYSVDYGISMRRYDPAGAALGNEQLVSVFEPAWQSYQSVALSPSGTAVVTWSSIPWDGCITTCGPPPPPPQDGSGSGVYGRMFDVYGTDVFGGEFRVNLTTAGDQSNYAVALRGAASGVLVFQSSDGSGTGLFVRAFGGLAEPARLEIDHTAVPSADGNGVLEPGEGVYVSPAWRNLSGSALAITGQASGFTGPAGPSYTLVDNSANYGVVPAGATASCRGTGDCFAVNVSGPRPVSHWDATLTEQVQPATLASPRTRAIHIGDSFLDVPRSSVFYRFIETVFHNDVIGSCAAGYYCPSFAVTREHMAPFVLAAFQPTLLPGSCVPGGEMFADVPASSMYCRWIEELARRGVVTGCGGGNYCPTLPVSRESLAVYLLATREGTSYAPPACGAPVFADVPASSPFCRWIEELYRRGIVGGCGGGRYCPTLAVARDQMSVFLTGTFGLLLYAP
jgi:hypothetical protein